MIIFQFLPRRINQLITESQIINSSTVKVIELLRWKNIQITYLRAKWHLTSLEDYITSPTSLWSDR